MDCRTAEEWICASLEGGALDAEASRHVDACDACRAYREDVARQDSELRASFEPLRGEATAIAERAIATLRRDHQRPLRFLPVILSAAAGFLLAFVFIRRDVRIEVREKEKLVYVNAGQVPPTVKRPMAKLEVATGRVQSSRDGSDWKDIDVGGGCEMDTWVRCADAAKAEFTLSDDSVVRLDAGSSCFFGKFRKFRLENGRLFARAMQGRVPFDVATENGRASVDEKAVAVLDVRHDGVKHEKKVMETSSEIIVLDGAATVHAGGKETKVEGPHAVLIVDETMGAPRKVGDPVLATKWIHDLLSTRGENPELTARVRALLSTDLARSGSALRDMGEGCAKPIAAWACGVKEPDERKRQQAVQIAADLATTRTIPDLITLLEDHDSGVRLISANALERLTGLTMGCGPSDWTNSDTSKDAAERWKKWQLQKDTHGGAVK